MSGVEQSTKGPVEALFGASTSTEVISQSSEAERPDARPILLVADWPSIGADLLDERRTPVPAFSLELLPQPWRDWVSAAARSSDVPVDYVAQSVLATFVGISSNRVLVLFVSGWLDPLQLRLATVGAPLAGESPACWSSHRSRVSTGRWPRRRTAGCCGATASAVALHRCAGCRTPAISNPWT